MATETELKFIVPPSGLTKIKHAGWVLGNKPPPKEVDVVSVYYDTASRDLRENGVTLRLRQREGRYLQTVKVDAGGFPRRQEWEREVESDRLDLSAVEGTALEPLLSGNIAHDLKPLFETRVRRSTIDLEQGTSKIEMSLDRGELKSGDLHSSISELELELKEGDPADLFAVARRIAEIVPLRLAVLSKADSGYRLADHEQQQPFHGTMIALDRKLSAAEAFQEVANSCLRQVIANEKAVEGGRSEGVHQMRIGLRRLRTAFAFFAKLTVADAHIEHIKSNLKWFTSQLSPARDLDVYLRKSVQPVDAMEPAVAGAGALEQVTERRRKVAFARAADAVRSSRYRQLILGVAEWINTGAWLDESNAKTRAQRDCPIAKFATSEMRRRRNKLAKKKKKLKKADASTRHKIRISAKKLRYATEFFATIFPGRKAAKRRRIFAKSLKRLQNSLGDLNDFAVHDRLASRLVLSNRTRARGRRWRRRAFAAGVVAGRESSQGDGLMKVAKRALRDVAMAKKYWEK